ncbi:nucleotidyltransferase family protein [Methanospirillum lacunae]|uniref:Bifunctional protein GlmU n=1 Tax=Methanospirillum lacunae TaxID=668570 RepID=A0A2V2N6A2_9EURY|nr:NDP-sugar synthase [Methanospirillum lacunae]PWR72018.1 mannose-1-phosphate guanyltransferase [Methanospirillum lacunae]
MKVCIMCGGEGTRLRPLTFERPKPCIPIVNKPSIEHLVSHLSNLGFHDVVITLGYKGDAIEQSLGDGALLGVSITYVYEESKLGTAGSVHNARKYLGDKPFLVVGGDHVTDLNLLEFYREHLKSAAIVTIGLISIDEPSEYGIAEIDVENRIRRFREKPGPGEIFSNLASTGMYVCSPEIFEYIPDGVKFDFAKNLFPLLMEKNLPLNGWLARGNWSDVGSPASLRQAEKWKLQEMRYANISGDLDVKNANIQGPVDFGNSIYLGNNSRVIGPVVIGSGTSIGDNVLIGPYTSIGKNCVIRNNVRLLSSSIYNRVVIGQGSSVSGTIVDNETMIGDGCSIEHGSVIGPRCVIRNRVTVHSNTRIWPDVVIADGTVVTEHVLNDEYDTRCEGS